MKRVSQTNEKTSRNQTLQQESNQRDKHLAGLPCKILEIDTWRTIGPEDKKFNDDAQGLTPERWHRLFVSKKEGERGVTNKEDSTDAAIRGYKHYIKRVKIIHSNDTILFIFYFAFFSFLQIFLNSRSCLRVSGK